VRGGLATRLWDTRLSRWERSATSNLRQTSRFGASPALKSLLDVPRRRTLSESVVACSFPSRRRHTRLVSDWSSDVCSSDLLCGAASVSDGMAATEITLWTMRTVEAQMGNLRADVAAFEQQNPIIKVTIEAVPYNVVYPKLAAAIQAGTPPNLFDNIEAMLAFMHAKQTLEPIDDVIDGLGRDQFTKKYLDWVTAGGKTWALPDWALHQAVYYRKDLLAQKKLSVPKSWAELLDVAKALNNAKDGMHGMGVPLGRE